MSHHAGDAPEVWVILPTDYDEYGILGLARTLDGAVEWIKKTYGGPDTPDRRWDEVKGEDGDWSLTRRTKAPSGPDYTSVYAIERATFVEDEEGGPA